MSAFVASMVASISILTDCDVETAIGTSPLFLVPGVPLINGVIDIVEGHVLVGFSRMVNAGLLLLCITPELSAHYMTMFLDSATMAALITGALVAGATLPNLIFMNYSLTMTRHRPRLRRH